ncbi:radical SAM protein [candidate division KSB1 bacterium]|nr:radical SAM protein [candidate division KSB1 bacterium]
MLKVNDIFYSIQGESSYAGLPCIFVRLAGCNLRCIYCDTRDAYENGKSVSIREIIKRVRQFVCPLVEITGGEPLLQSETPGLMEALLAQGFRVLLETNGSMDIDMVPKSVVRIMDMKCPDSGESERMDWNNLAKITMHDEVKFVISSHEDFRWAADVTREYSLSNKTKVIFSPVYGVLKENELAQWILDDKLNVRFQIQLHKILSMK